jgi:Terminase large subunit, T4likevirus-type, N-terminal
MGSKNLDGVLIKRANQKQKWSEEDIAHMIKCSDPDEGPQYFLNNFFYIQHPVQGRLKYNAYSYQLELLSSYHTHRFSVNMLGRQMGKTTTAVGYLLWYAMFVPNSTILIAAHKYTGAQEIMQRLRYAYEMCPDNIRAGVTSYNKQSIEFENGSRIVAQTTTETTGRGMSVSLLYCDEFAYVEPNIAVEFWTSISPTLATGGKAIITSTPNSDEDQFAQIWNEANKRFNEYGDETVLGRNGFYPYMAIWSQHPDRDEEWANTERSRVGVERFEREHECLAGDSLLKIKFPNGDIKLLSIFELEDLLKNSNCL